MYSIKEFKSEDFSAMKPQKEQEDEYNWMKKWTGVMLPWIEEENNTVTVFRNEEPIVIIGCIPDRGCTEFWSLVSKNIGIAGMIVATRYLEICQESLKMNGHKALKTPIRDDFEAGKRWAKMFGLKPTGKKADMLMTGTAIYEYWRKEL